MLAIYQHWVKVPNSIGCQFSMCSELIPKLYKSERLNSENLETDTELCHLYGFSISACEMSPAIMKSGRNGRWWPVGVRGILLKPGGADSLCLPTE